jgi:cytidylate kinase
MIITIDGPVASGKSSVAKAIAKELSIYYLYTGLLYRAVAYILKDRTVKTITPELLDFIKDINYDYGALDGEPHIFYQDKDITEHLYDASIGKYASIISANKHVRDALISIQQDVAKRYDVVADGRDCGSVVFPNADYKFYLTADIDARARRVMLDERRGATAQNVEKAKARLEERDVRDKEREVSPLVVPEGAIIIDNSNLTLNETIQKFLGYISR